MHSNYVGLITHSSCARATSSMSCLQRCITQFVSLWTFVTKAIFHGDDRFIFSCGKYIMHTCICTRVNCAWHGVEDL